MASEDMTVLQSTQLTNQPSQGRGLQGPESYHMNRGSPFSIGTWHMSSRHHPQKERGDREKIEKTAYFGQPHTQRGC